MPITSTNTFRLFTIQHVDIDCSSVSGDVRLQDQFAQLLSWVQSIPQRSAVHVTLRSATGSVTGRKLKSIFQSLGCTVMMKTSF